MMALITNVNNPSVNIFSGKVNIINIGLIEIFSKPKIIDAMSKSIVSINSIPENIKLAAPSESEFITHRKTIFLNTIHS